MDSMFRVRSCKEGWVAEIKVAKWTLFGIKYKWKPFIHINDCACVFSTCRGAEEEILNKVEFNILLENIIYDQKEN